MYNYWEDDVDYMPGPNTGNKTSGLLFDWLDVLLDKSHKVFDEIDRWKGDSKNDLTSRTVYTRTDQGPAEIRVDKNMMIIGAGMVLLFLALK